MRVTATFVYDLPLCSSSHRLRIIFRFLPERPWATYDAKNGSMKKADLSKTDTLAIERTRLANERTFLAYFRSSIVFLSSGFAIIKINALQEITDIGYFLLVIAPILFLTGLIRFFYVRKKVRKYFYTDVEE